MKLPCLWKYKMVLYIRQPYFKVARFQENTYTHKHIYMVKAVWDCEMIPHSSDDKLRKHSNLIFG